MERDAYARWLQSKLHETFDALSTDQPPDELEELARQAAAAIERKEQDSG